jgi:hypothetical protein
LYELAGFAGAYGVVEQRADAPAARVPEHDDVAYPKAAHGEF